ARSVVGRRAPDNPGRLLGPDNQRLPALPELLMVSWLLPAAVDPSTACRRLEGQPLDIFGTSLKVVERGRRSDGVSEGRVGCDIGDKGAVDIHGTAIAQRREMLGPGLTVH